MNNLEGYSKNKDQIHKIQKYKGTLQQKLTQVMDTEKKTSDKLKELMPKLKDVEKKLKDEKYTMSLEQEEYNDLLQQNDDLKKAVEENTTENKKSKERIIELKGKIGKCDLAWKTLFANKDWDEIQLRAANDKERFTRKVDEKNPPIKPKLKENNEEEIIKKQVGDFVDKVKQEESENNLPVKLSRWDKIKNFLRHPIKSMKEKLNRDNEEDKNPEQKDKVTTKQRDEFIEGLRQYADEEYKKQVRKEKDEQYRETHKVKPKEEKDTKETEETR